MQRLCLLALLLAVYVLHTAEAEAHNGCGKYQWRCRSTKCVSYWKMCDSKNHCGDWSDEWRTKGPRPCSATTGSCGKGKYVCASGHCVNWKNVCDGSSDCADGSDEANCATTAGSCGSDMYQCADGQCIQWARTCDGRAQCSDGSDEGATRCPRKDKAAKTIRCRNWRYRAKHRRKCGWVKRCVNRRGYVRGRQTRRRRRRCYF